MDNGQKGFGLIQLLAVVGILAALSALAAVAIPTYSRFFGQGGPEDEGHFYRTARAF